MSQLTMCQSVVKGSGNVGQHSFNFNFQIRGSIVFAHFHANVS